MEFGIWASPSPGQDEWQEKRFGENGEIWILIAEEEMPEVGNMRVDFNGVCMGGLIG